MRHHAANTVWQPDVVASFPGVLGWQQLQPLMQSTLQPSGANLPDLHPNVGLDAALARFEVYWVDSQLRSLPPTGQGPQWRQQQHVAEARQAVGVQAAGPNAKFATAPLLPPGLSKSAHMQFASCLSSPFDATVQLDDDSTFVCRGMCTLGPRSRVWRQQQLRAFRRVAKFLHPWEEALTRVMHPDVAAVARQRKPAFITLLLLVMRWPDTALGLRFVQGFKLLGVIESQGIFRPLTEDPPLQLGLSSLLGSHAERITATRRFMLAQGNKLRAIDDGRFSGHNKSCFSEETIYTSSPDYVAAACKVIGIPPTPKPAG